MLSAPPPEYVIWIVIKSSACNDTLPKPNVEIESAPFVIVADNDDAAPFTQRVTV